MTSHDIQKNIVTACKIETIKSIIKDLNGDYFALLVDESRDMSHKEQMAICLQYVDNKGFVIEVFIGPVYVKDTSALSLKKVIADVLAYHSFTLSYVHGNVMMRQVIFKELLLKELMNLENLNKKLREALDMGELEMGRGLNQELGLIKLDDTCWESHYKLFGNFVSNLASIVDALDILVENVSTLDEKLVHRYFSEVIKRLKFLLCLMTDNLGITNDLNVSFQKKKRKDITNTMILVKITKRRLQSLTVNKWDPILKKNIGCDSLKEKVDAFCVKHNIPLPNYDEPFANFGRSRRKVVDYTTLYHYRVNVFYKIINWQELNDRFNEVTSDLLNEVACLNSVDSFSSFDIKKIVRMIELYPDDFDEFKMRALENQLSNYIIDVRDIDKRFSNLGGLGELFRKLIETKKHLNYFLVFLLVKFALIPPVAIASVEKAFLVMKYIKNDLRNRMNHEFLDDCIVPYVEKKIKYLKMYLVSLL